MRGTEGRGSRRKGILTPGDCGGAAIDLENAVRRRRGHRFQLEKQPRQYAGKYRFSARLVRMNKFGSYNAATETMYLMVERIARFTFVNRQPARCTNKQPRWGIFGQLCARTTAENQPVRALLAKVRFRRHSWSQYDQPTAPLRLQEMIQRAEGMGSTLYGCVKWSQTLSHHTIPRTVHHRRFLRCIRWKIKPRDGYQVIFIPRRAGLDCV